MELVWAGLGALVVLALAGRFVWWYFTEENFALAAGILWAIGFVAAYFLGLGDDFVVRLPVGFVAFAVTSIVTLPLSWLADSKIALVALVAAQLPFSFYAGRAGSSWLRARVLPRYAAGKEPAWLRQEGDVIADLGRWAVLAFAALMVVIVAPLLLLLVVTLIVDLTAQQIQAGSALWGLSATTWYGLQARAVRWARIPACAWIYAALTAAIFAADLLAGPLAEGTGVKVAYTTLPGALVAAFVEVFVFGGGKFEG